MHATHAHPRVLSSRPLQLKNSSRSSVATKTVLGASNRVDKSPPETTTIVQRDLRGGSSTLEAKPELRTWSPRTPQCAFKLAYPVKNLAHEAQLPPKPGLAPRTHWTKVLQNDYDSAIKCKTRLKPTLCEAKNASMEHTHTPVCFQNGLFG